MSSSTFQIVLVDGQTLTQNVHILRVFTDIGGSSSPRLESYTHEGNWLDLRFSGGYEMRIPEHHVAHIAIRPASN